MLTISFKACKDKSRSAALTLKVIKWDDGEGRAMLLSYANKIIEKEGNILLKLKSWDQFLKAK